MKESAFNLVIPLDKNRNILFNSFTKKFFYISQRNTESCIFFLKNLNEFFDENIKFLIDELYKNGFIVDDDRDELAELKANFYDYKNSKVLDLMILTTYSCNFSCWYCVQKHKGINLTNGIELQIKKHIEQYVLSNAIEHLTLSWFGGEPLLNVGSIQRISEFAIDFCKKNSIGFNNVITTNGSLLSPSVISILEKLNFTNFQITIDGDKLSHNHTRNNLLIKDSFSLILSNIAKLANSLPGAIVFVRINYTNKNLSESLVDDLDEYLCDVKKNVSFLFRKVWQEKETQSMDDKLALIVCSLHQKGYRIISEFDDFNIASCYVECKHHHSIFPNGCVDRCSNKDINKTRGYLDETGNIVWKQIPTECNTNVFDVKGDCTICKFLPICMGPCPESRRKFDGILRCQMEDKQLHFQNAIKRYCTTKEILSR